MITRCCPECYSENISCDENDVVMTTAERCKNFLIKDTVTTIANGIISGISGRPSNLSVKASIPTKKHYMWRCNDCGATFRSPAEIED